MIPKQTKQALYEHSDETGLHAACVMGAALAGSLGIEWAQAKAGQNEMFSSSDLAQLLGVPVGVVMWATKVNDFGGWTREMIAERLDERGL